MAVKEQTDDDGHTLPVLLLSIHPEYTEKIFSGEKRFEYRTMLFVRCGKVLIYETRPTQKIVGECGLGDAVTGTPEEIWKLTGKDSGMTESEFFTYYDKKNRAYAYPIIDPARYDEPKGLKDFGIESPPQSFRYLNHLTEHKRHAEQKEGETCKPKKTTRKEAQKKGED